MTKIELMSAYAAAGMSADYLKAMDIAWKAAVQHEREEILKLADSVGYINKDHVLERYDNEIAGLRADLQER